MGIPQGFRESERGIGKGRSSDYVDSKQKVSRALLTQDTTLSYSWFQITTLIEFLTALLTGVRNKS